jgi:hypothetical protein
MLLKGINQPRYQWYWMGNQEETATLTPDLKHTVNRHIIVKRVIPDDGLPIHAIAAQLSKLSEADGASAGTSWDSRRPEQTSLEYLFDFGFCIKVRQEFLLNSLP